MEIIVINHITTKHKFGAIYYSLNYVKTSLFLLELPHQVGNNPSPIQLS